MNKARTYRRGAGLLARLVTFPYAAPMLSVVIATKDGDEERLAHTLASLVPAAVEGVLREVVVSAPEGAPGVHAVAEHAGCRLAGSLSAAVGAAKGEWLLFLEPGARLREGWSESALAHASARSGPARFTAEASGWRRWARRLAGRKRRLARGLLIRRAEAAAAVEEGGSGESLGRKLWPRTLPARLVPAE